MHTHTYTRTHAPAPAEMSNGRPLFAGTSENDQLDRIFRHLGTPSEAVYPAIVELPEFQKVKVRT